MGAGKAKTPVSIGRLRLSRVSHALCLFLNNYLLIARIWGVLTEDMTGKRWNGGMCLCFYVCDKIKQRVLRVCHYGEVDEEGSECKSQRV